MTSKNCLTKRQLCHNFSFNPTTFLSFFDKHLLRELAYIQSKLFCDHCTFSRHDLKPFCCFVTYLLPLLCISLYCPWNHVATAPISTFPFLKSMRPSMTKKQLPLVLSMSCAFSLRPFFQYSRETQGPFPSLSAAQTQG